MTKHEDYLGISGLTLVWYNRQDDNELVYDGIHADYVDIQEAVYERFCEQFRAQEGCSEEFYDFWLKSHPEYILDEMLLTGDWLFDNKVVGHGKYHSYLEKWKYEKMLESTKTEKEETTAA